MSLTKDEIRSRGVWAPAEGGVTVLSLSSPPIPQLVTLYEQHRPEQAKHVDVLLKAHAGKEAELLAKVQKKFAANPAPPPAAKRARAEPSRVFALGDRVMDALRVLDITDDGDLCASRARPGRFAHVKQRDKERHGWMERRYLRRLPIARDDAADERGDGPINASHLRGGTRVAAEEQRTAARDDPSALLRANAQVSPAVVLEQLRGFPKGTAPGPSGLR
eukprot:gene20978-47926_t